MKMTEIISVDGRILGFVDADFYPNNGRELVIDDAPKGFTAHNIGEDMPETFRIYRLPRRYVEFCNERDRQKRSYLVADGPIPDWVWEQPGVIPFVTDMWR